jgi:hypothetical protein
VRGRGAGIESHEGEEYLFEEIGCMGGELRGVT